MVKNILRELTAERGALCLPLTPCPLGLAVLWLQGSPHTYGPGVAQRKQEVPNVGRSKKTGVEGGDKDPGQSEPFHTWPYLLELSGKQARVFLGSVFPWQQMSHLIKWFKNIHCLLVSWNSYTISMGRKIYDFKLNSLPLKMFLQTGIRLTTMSIPYIHSIAFFPFYSFF